MNRHKGRAPKPKPEADPERAAARLRHCLTSVGFTEEQAAIGLAACFAAITESLTEPLSDTEASVTRLRGSWRGQRAWERRLDTELAWESFAELAERMDAWPTID